MKILSVELENVKRVSLVRMTVSEKGMTTMGMKEYKPREESNDFQENRPHIGFGPG